jgi:8-oxo-dGTP diphosphatase
MSDRRPRTVSAFLHNGRGEVLVQLRDSKPGLRFPRCWSTLGGAMEAGESPEQAMQRELIEEIEICPPLTFWRTFDHRYAYRGQEVEVQVHAFTGLLDIPAEAVRLHEGERVAWLNAADIERLPFAFGLDALFREFFATYDHRNHTGDHLSSQRRNGTS